MEGTPSTDSRRAVISARGLTKHYGSVRALTDLTLEVREGEIFGFLGPNGAGKSTTIRTLLGFLQPTKGGATVLDLDIILESVEIRRHVGYLPGGIALYDSLTGEQVLDYLADLQGREPRRRAELCDRLELPGSVLRRKVRDYSRGMRQKVGVVQALQHDPELAILDEPTEGLDPLMQQAFYRLLDDLRRQGKTVFFSSHVLSEVERLCDRVAIIRAGELMAIHEVAELLARRRRKVALRWRGGAPDPASLPGLEDVETDGNRVTGTLSGDMAGFIRAIASPSLEDLTIEPASLEEAFLEYYATDQAPA
jgi:ABC-2 type transport system ATP-binding protein